MTVEDLKRFIREVPDFPKPGILFRDITPLLREPRALAAAAKLLADPHRASPPAQILGIESRGFILGPLVARELGAGFVPVRKKGKLPWRTLQESYALEYGTDTVEMHVDAVAEGERVVIIDDLIATGGTALAAARLVERAGGRLLGLGFLIELAALGGRQHLGERPISSLIRY